MSTNACGCAVKWALSLYARGETKMSDDLYFCYAKWDEFTYMNTLILQGKGDALKLVVKFLFSCWSHILIFKKCIKHDRS